MYAEAHHIAAAAAANDTVSMKFSAGNRGPYAEKGEQDRNGKYCEFFFISLLCQASKTRTHYRLYKYIIVRSRVTKRSFTSLKRKILL